MGRAPANAAAPNVVMIVLDDLGFDDLGCYGSEIETPHIDALAESGLRYNNFHVTAICSASRACLLTGRNHHAVGMGQLNHPTPFPGYSGRIPRSAGTLPRLLVEAGHNTFAVGKWHLTPASEMTPAGPFDRWPLGLGFERYYGFLGALSDQWAPDLVADNGFVEPPRSVDDGYHLTADLATRAIRFVQDQQHAAPGKPFFLYFATGAMHYPHHVPTTWIEPYRNRFDDGWDAVRQRTFTRQRNLGVVPATAALTTRPPWVTAWDDLSFDERRLFARQMEVYAGFLTHTDAQIGRIVEFLDRMDLLENTLLMVLSDNGASADGGPNGATTPEDMSEVNSVTAMATHVDALGGPRAFNHYAWGWAWAGNTPFRLWKQYTWLGGVRTPLIVRWPAGIDLDQHGGVRTQFCHAIDLMPTILEGIRGEAPALLDGESQQPLDGKSIFGTLSDAQQPAPRSIQYFEMMGSRAIYRDGWKATTNHVVDAPAQRNLVEGSGDFNTDRWSLFNTAEDFSETHDLAATHPEQLRQLIELWWYEAGRNQVLPLSDNFTDRTAATAPTPYLARQRYVYLPDGGPIHVPASLATGFRMAADIEISAGHRPAGVICAQGDWHGGWALYVLDGQLVATFTVAGTPNRIATHDVRLCGAHEIGVTYLPGNAADGVSSVRLTFDGRDVASAQLPERAGPRFRRGRTLLIGRDQGLPVCDDYRPPFAFTGPIHRIVLDLSPRVEAAPTLAV